jgi:hypothetical protein
VFKLRTCPFVKSPRSAARHVPQGKRGGVRNRVSACMHGHASERGSFYLSVVRFGMSVIIMTDCTRMGMKAAQRLGILLGMPMRGA